MGRIHHDHVNSGLNQRGYPCIGISTCADSCASPKTTLFVLAGQRIILRLLDILDGDQPAQFEVVIHDQDFFNAVAMQQLFHVVQIGALFHRHQLVLGGHDFRDRRVQAAFKANITTGDDTNEIDTVHHRQPRNVVGHGDVHEFANRSVRRHRDRILNDATFELLDLADGRGLLLNRHALVHDADATFLSHGNGQISFGHGIHSR